MLIAQITDLHIGAGRRLAYRKVDTARALENAVQHVMALDPRPDIVLFTGDIGDLGTAEEYALVRDILRDLTIAYYMVPGNHDRRGALRTAFLQAIPVTPDQPFLQYVIDDFPVRLIGLDTLDEGMPGGKLCAARLDWLQGELAIATDKPRLIFMHHPPVLTGIRHMDVQNLGDGADELGGLLRKSDGVIGLICGHVHRPIHSVWQGVPISIGPSVAHQVALDVRPDGPSAFIMEPPAMHLHFWSPQQGLMTHTSYIGHFDGPYPFFDENGKLIV
ncbi:MAG: phosphodiesterase [Pseudomonadota bacterium]